MEFATDFARAWRGADGIAGRLRSAPEDFRVEELMPPGFFTGEGEHLCLRLRKTGQNTHWVAEQIAHRLGLARHEVGYAGRKDRHAVTTQWFSVPARSFDTGKLGDIPGCEVLDQVLHQRKIRPGDHAGNGFVIIVRDLPAETGVLTHRLGQIASSGFPNYFGPQRFGHTRQNLVRGWEAIQAGRRLRGRNEGIYLSALRSWLFNAILDAHIRSGNWPEIAASPEQWTGALWGRGRSRPGNSAESAIEARLCSNSLTLCEALEFSGLNQERRTLCAGPGAFAYEWEQSGRLRLEFELLPGQFATELIAELCDADEPSPQER